MVHGPIRLKLLKIGALVRTSVRRIKLAMSSASGSSDRCGGGERGESGVVFGPASGGIDLRKLDSGSCIPQSQSPTKVSR